MLAVLYAGGVRRAELAGPTLADVRDDEFGPHLRVLGKGNRERRVFLEPGARTAVAGWLELRGDWAGALCRISKGGRLPLPGNPDNPVPALSTHAVYDIVRKPARTAGLEEGVSPHDFRRTLLTHLLQRGREVFTVQAIAGHADPSTTQRYDRRGEEQSARRARRYTSRTWDGSADSFSELGVHACYAAPEAEDGVHRVHGATASTVRKSGSDVLPYGRYTISATTGEISTNNAITPHRETW